MTQIIFLRIGLSFFFFFAEGAIKDKNTHQVQSLHIQSNWGVGGLMLDCDDTFQ